eukprot:scaffold8790_cov187-Amphora_coffeaeformis.AAC.6
MVYGTSFITAHNIWQQSANHCSSDGSIAGHASVLTLGMQHMAQQLHIRRPNGCHCLLVKLCFI